jgi:acid phosphatase class B
MIIGLDYWQVCSHYPEYFRQLAAMHLAAGDTVYVISGVGQSRLGTVRDEVEHLNIPHTEVIEVLFDQPMQSPDLKLAKCQELGVSVFYDDRDDVCRLLNKNGILAMRVLRKDNSAHDLEAERT